MAFFVVRVPLNNYMRSTQSEERLSSLAIIHVNYTDLDINEICKTFIQKHPRKLEKASLLLNF